MAEKGHAIAGAASGQYAWYKPVQEVVLGSHSACAAALEEALPACLAAALVALHLPARYEHPNESLTHIGRLASFLLIKMQQQLAISVLHKSVTPP